MVRVGGQGKEILDWEEQSDPPAPQWPITCWAELRRPLACGSASCLLCFAAGGTLRHQPHGSRPPWAVSTPAPSLPPPLPPSFPSPLGSCLLLLALAYPTSKLDIGRHKIGIAPSTLYTSLRLKFAPPKAIRCASSAEHSRHAPNQGCLTCGLPSVEMNLISFCVNRASCGNIAESLILD